jgi:protein required for attachment to host cells
MSKTLYVVLSKSSMKLFTRANRSEPLKHFKTMPNELVDLTPGELRRHQPGTSARGPRGSFGVSREVFNGGERSQDLATEQFARQIAEFLNHERTLDRVRELKIAADPKLTGLLRKSLSKETLQSVQVWIGKDLEKADVEQLDKSFKAG